MRIIAGDYRGRRLQAPRGQQVRPTADRVKESLFNILGLRSRGAQVLDLFAGSGALGLEALSRGARKAVFVENDAAAVRALRENVARLVCQERVTVIRGTLPRALSEVPGLFDLVFLDPPYGSFLADVSLEALGQGSVVSPQGLVVAEHSRRDDLPEGAGSLLRVDRRRYGDTELSFYARRD